MAVGVAVGYKVAADVGLETSVWVVTGCLAVEDTGQQPESKSAIIVARLRTIKKAASLSPVVIPECQAVTL